MSGAVVALGSSVGVRSRAAVSALGVVSVAVSVMSEASVPAAYIQVTARDSSSIVMRKLSVINMIVIYSITAIFKIRFVITSTSVATRSGFN